MKNLILDVAVDTPGYYGTEYGMYSTIVCGIIIAIALVVAGVVYFKLSKKEKSENLEVGSKPEEKNEETKEEVVEKSTKEEDLNEKEENEEATEDETKDNEDAIEETKDNEEVEESEETKEEE